VRALAIQQEGRGLAMMGDAAGSDSRLDRADDMIREAAAQPENLPPWLYFFNPDYLGLQRGLADIYLGRYQRAIEALTSNLSRLPGELRGSDWIGWYVLQLAIAYAKVGNQEAASAALEEARVIAEGAAAQRLASDVRRQARRLGL
jgi:tetratricopeptide (TPR) repeat protein